MMDRWRAAIIVIGAVGLADAAYLSADVLSPQAVLYCPTTGIVNCITVTQSAYSEFLGVKVAYLGLAWFAAVIALTLLANRVPPEYALLPLWGLGVVFVLYLVLLEIFVLNAVCVYCTVAHALALVLGLPIIKVALRSDT